VFYIILSLLWLLTSCSGGSSSGGGSAQNGQAPPPAVPVPVTYTNSDLAGTWRWNAKGQLIPDTFSGSISFNKEVGLIGFSPDRCPGSQVPNAEFWLWSDGFVKGRFYSFCSDPTAEVKFGMNFSSNKKTIAGIMDLHYLIDGTETYDRFNITLTKQ
jgi:hypothetical protein